MKRVRGHLETSMILFLSFLPDRFTLTRHVVQEDARTPPFTSTTMSILPLEAYTSLVHAISIETPSEHVRMIPRTISPL